MLSAACLIWSSHVVQIVHLHDAICSEHVSGPSPHQQMPLYLAQVRMQHKALGSVTFGPTEDVRASLWLLASLLADGTFYITLTSEQLLQFSTYCLSLCCVRQHGSNAVEGTWQTRRHTDPGLPKATSV